MTVLTISRQMGSFGDEIAEALARRLNWTLITRDRLIELFFAPETSRHEQHMLSESARFYLNTFGEQGTYLDYLRKKLSEHVARQPSVLVGFGSQILFADDPAAVHVRITAPEDIRIGRVRRQFSLSVPDAGRVVETAERKHRRFVSTLYGVDLTENHLYDLTLNTASLSVEDCVAAILAVQTERGRRREMEMQVVDSEIVVNPTERTFKNPAEIEFARILDMYQIEWVYEPKTFPIEWDAEGNVTLAFSPDFYLPQFDTYIELTTMNQRYVTIKNRKAKKLRELYPGINIKIVYKKDFQSLIERFNMFGGG